MSAKNGKLAAPIVFSTTQTATFTEGGSGPVAVSVPAGSYYPDEIVAAILVDLVALGSGNWEVTISDGESGTGLVTIDDDVGEYPFSITWTTDEMRDALGFTGNITNVSAAQTGTNHVKGLWLPGVPKWSPHGDEDGGGDIGVLVTDKVQTMSGYGHVKTLMSTERREIRGIKWQGVLQSRARTRYESYANESFEQFWRDTQNGNTVSYFVAGSPVRFYPDADVDATYSTVKIVGLNEFDPQTLVPNWVGRYVVEIPLMVKVPA